MNLPSLPTAVRGANLLAVALLGLALAQLTWRLVPVPEKVGSAPIPEPPSASGAPGAGTTLADVANLHLFGQADAPALAPRVAPADAPETRLNLNLRGLMAAGDGQKGYAIIGDPRGEEGFYRVNAKLPGGAQLVEIRRDRVILQRGDQYETLKLPRELADFGAGKPAAVPASPSADAASEPEVTREVGDEEPGGAPPAAQLSAYRDRLLTNPSEIGRLAQMQPVMQDGQIKGYRLTPGAERELFRHAGLQAGDIVTSINGIPLSDPSLFGQVFQQLSSVNRFSLTVERGGRLESLSIDLGQ